jgi:hypothetical protein
MNYTEKLHLHSTNIKRIYVILHMLADFMAAFLFLVGSILFLYPKLLDLGTWLFIFGSLLFAFKPTLKIIHFFHLKMLFKNIIIKKEDILKSKTLHWDL